MIGKNREIYDLCGNGYFIEEASDIQGKFLEVYEIVNVNGVKSKSYLFDIDMTLADTDNDILDEIDETIDSKKMMCK